ncbi:hypothetical protein HK098_005964 [Nowakowskiella sp. JEL0407]|nr:hypothetical protein HK098_005964 [Nowakowskiella sp. JEL0407]
MRNERSVLKRLFLKDMLGFDVEFTFPAQKRKPDLIMRIVLDEDGEAMTVDKVILDHLTKRELGLMKKMRCDFLSKRELDDNIIILGFKDGSLCFHSTE